MSHTRARNSKPKICFESFTTLPQPPPYSFKFFSFPLHQDLLRALPCLSAGLCIRHSHSIFPFRLRRARTHRSRRCSYLLVALGPARAIALAGSSEEGAAGVTVCILAVCASESGAPPQFTRPHNTNPQKTTLLSDCTQKNPSKKPRFLSF